MPKSDWQDRACAATRATKFGAILRCALGRDQSQAPRFEGRASVTSDGYVMCSFVGIDGEARSGAFVGDVKDLEENVRWRSTSS